MLDRSMFDKLISQVTTGAGDLNSKVDQKFGDNAGLAKGAAAAGLGALLLGGGGLARTVGIGGLGALAYHVISNRNQNKDVDAVQADTAPVASVPTHAPQLENLSAEDEDRHTKLMMSAMIAAANADGHISKEERSRISDALDTLDIGREGRLYLLDEMSAPKDLRAVASMVRNDVEAGEVYLLSSMVVDSSDREGQVYLSNLAMVLDIDPDTVKALDEARPVA